MSEKLNIAEQFYSVQGEGPHAGTPAIFLRMAGCNLVCGGRENAYRDPEKMKPEGDATWVCDTIDVWREVESVVAPRELVTEWHDRGFIEPIENGAHIVLTGGEPMMPQNQEALVRFYQELCGDIGFHPFIEVETNGTYTPVVDFHAMVDQYNVSMKLSNSGMEAPDRINPEAIDYFKNGAQNARFKFVASNHKDVKEILDLQKSYDIPDSMISLMPAGQTREQMDDRYATVMEVCKERGWYFSPRLQVNAWNEVTGV